MEYQLNHTLEHKSKLQTALGIWQDSNIIDKILRHYRDGTYRDIPARFKFEEELLNGIINAIVDSSLPHLLKADLCETIGAVGRQILNYMNLLADNFYESLEKIERMSIENIIWTENGVINMPGSLKYLIRNTKHLALDNSYRLSCMYCIDENLIHELWWNLPEDVRHSEFYEKEIYQSASFLAIAYWKHYRDGTLSGLINHLSSSLRGVDVMLDFNESVEENLFRCCAAYSTNEATVFFYNKIAEDQRQRCLLRCMKILLSDMIPDGEEILFILSKMDEEIRLYVIHQFSNSILKPLLDSWPWRELYISVFDKITYLTKDMFLSIFNDIIRGIKDADKSYMLKVQLILSKIWNKSILKEYKKCIYFFQAFMILLKVGNVENVVLIAMDKATDNDFLIHLAFFIIFIKFSHLLGKFEDLVNEKMKPENISEESLKYCLSEFLINEDYEAVTEILSWYFGNRREELEKFKTNFPFNTVFKEVWKNEMYTSPAEQSEKVLECVLGKDKKKIEIAKSRFSEEECLFGVYSFILNSDQVDSIEELVVWLKITKDYENYLKRRFVQESLTDTCIKLISKTQIHSLNKLVNYLFDENPTEFITNFILNYGVKSCISLVSFVEVSDLEVFEDENLIADRCLLYADFIDTWVDESNLTNTIHRELTAYGKPSEHSNEINIADNIYEPTSETLKKWELIDSNYSKFLSLLMDY